MNLDKEPNKPRKNPALKNFLAEDTKLGGKEGEKKSILDQAKTFIAGLLERMQLGKIIERESRSQRERLKREMQLRTGLETLFGKRDANEHRPESENVDRKNLNNLFREIPVDHIQYPFDRFSRQLRRWCGEQRLGADISRDIVGIALGTVESLLVSLKLVADIVFDAGRFVIQPRKEFIKTRSIKD